jgi:hypothetical protein
MEIASGDGKGPGMKRAAAAAAAAWLVEHLTFGGKNEELAGDLLEELEPGRPAGRALRMVQIFCFVLIVLTVLGL